MKALRAEQASVDTQVVNIWDASWVSVHGQIVSRNSSPREDI